MRDTHSTAKPCLPPASPRKPFALRALPLFFLWPTIGFPTLYINKGDSFKIIGSHNHSFSAMFQTVCLWSHVNFDHNSCVSNETKPLAEPKNPAQHVAEVSLVGLMLHCNSGRNTQGPCFAFSGAFCRELLPPFKRFWRMTVARWILGPGLFCKVLRIHFGAVVLVVGRSTRLSLL